MNLKEYIQQEYEVLYPYRDKDNKVELTSVYEQNAYKQGFLDSKPLDFADWIAENWSPNGRKGCWDSNERNSRGESKYLVDSTEALYLIFLKEKNEN